MKITQKDLIGEIKGFPIEVVRKMVERQVEQGNTADVRVFQKMYDAGRPDGGFNWDGTIEEEYEEGFWDNVIMYKNFDLFFEKYPKSEEEKEEEDCWIDPKGRRMLVWHYDEEQAVERIVIAKLPLKSKWQYVAVHILDEYKFEEGQIYDTTLWRHAKPIPAQTKLSLSSIAEKFGLNPNEIEIDFDK